MSPQELDTFLGAERMCRVATINGDGSPHTSALWFVWDGTSIWLTSIVKSQRWVNLMRDPRISVLVDAGHGYGELQGAELNGEVVVVGEVPRTGEAVAELEQPERLMGQKYMGGAFGHDKRHAWLRLDPDKVVSWDFRKIPLG